MSGGSTSGGSTSGGSTESVPSFRELGLSAASLKALAHVKYETPSLIQAAFIPQALSGRDCIGQARTGTGKTASFCLPILEKIDSDHSAVQALVLTPTRELSAQVAAECEKLAYTRPVKLACCVGGKLINRQIEEIRRGAQIVIGTPGRVIDLQTRGVLVLSDLKIIVLDEADRMLDIGFRPDIEKILRRCPTERQTLLLSATLPGPVERLAQRYMQNPLRVDVSQNQVAVETVDQYYITVDRDRKLTTLARLLYEERPRQAIVFCRTKRGADSLHNRLSRRLPHVAAIHGDLAQNVRDRVMKQFRDGTVRLLIATDVVGRGIDVTGVSHIINYDVPEDCDDYVHRIGRTGRLSGEAGFAFTFITPEEGDQLTNIEIRINKLLPQYQFTDFEPVRSRPARPPASAVIPPSPPSSVVTSFAVEEDDWAIL